MTEHGAEGGFRLLINEAKSTTTLKIRKLAEKQVTTNLQLHNLHSFYWQHFDLRNCQGTTLTIYNFNYLSVDIMKS